MLFSLMEGLLANEAAEGVINTHNYAPRQPSGFLLSISPRLLSIFPSFLIFFLSSSLISLLVFPDFPLKASILNRISWDGRRKPSAVATTHSLTHTITAFVETARCLRPPSHSASLFSASVKRPAQLAALILASGVDTVSHRFCHY